MTKYLKCLPQQVVLILLKTERMHDLVMGLFINRYELGRAV